MGFESKSVQFFWSRVDKDAKGECWYWTGAKTGRGYGSYRREGFRVAHRFSYTLHNGEIADGLCICHTCDQRACVNPAHLYAGTHRQNMRDMSKRNRHGHARLTDGDVERMLEALREGESLRTLATAFDVSTSCVAHIRAGRTWRHIKRGNDDDSV